MEFYTFPRQRIASWLSIPCRAVSYGHSIRKQIVSGRRSTGRIVALPIGLETRTQRLAFFSARLTDAYCSQRPNRPEGARVRKRRRGKSQKRSGGDLPGCGIRRDIAACKIRRSRYYLPDPRCPRAQDWDRAAMCARDVRTGRLVWTFHTVPQPGEAGHETWEGDSWKTRTGVNVWTSPKRRKGAIGSRDSGWNSHVSTEPSRRPETVEACVWKPPARRSSALR